MVRKGQPTPANLTSRSVRVRAPRRARFTFTDPYGNRNQFYVQFNVQPNGSVKRTITNSRNRRIVKTFNRGTAVYNLIKNIGTNRLRKHRNKNNSNLIENLETLFM